jgi:hypothetical protein
VWNRTFADMVDGTEIFLREHTRPVIEGKKLYVSNGGTVAHRVQQRHVNARMARGVGRVCPCGGEPVVLPMGQEYIAYCMGVRVDPALLPPEYQQARIVRRRSPRLMGLDRTRGRVRAEKKAVWRVNIERRWVPGGDDYTGMIILVGRDIGRIDMFIGVRCTCTCT